MHELVILGSGGEQPNRLRTASGALLRTPRRSLLLDPGEGCLKQLLLLGLAATEIRWIFVSHRHLDHCLGLPAILDAAHPVADRPIEILYPAGADATIDRLLGLAGFEDDAAVARRQLDDGDTLEIERGRLMFRRLDHDVPTLGLRYESLEGLGLAFVPDTLPCEGAADLARGVDLLVCQASDGEKRAEHVHRRKLMTAGDAARLAAASGARRLLLTHFQPGLQEVNALLYEARRSFADTDVARDLTTYRVSHAKPPGT